jgi:hypothetical protein
VHLGDQARDGGSEFYEPKFGLGIKVCMKEVPAVWDTTAKFRTISLFVIFAAQVTFYITLASSVEGSITRLYTIGHIHIPGSKSQLVTAAKLKSHETFRMAAKTGYGRAETRPETEERRTLDRKLSLCLTN